MAHFQFVGWLVEWILNQSGFAFEWDSGNIRKSLDKHGVTCQEAEEVFEQREAIHVLGKQIIPSTEEPRFAVLWVTGNGRHLFVCFTLRGSGIRVISTREMNKKERELYEELCEE